MNRAFFYLLLLLHLEGCGVLYPYFYDAQTLQDRLAVSMPKDDVVKRLGKPDRVVRADGEQLIWEYRLYPRGEWAAYLIHCPFFPNCYFPAEAGNPYYLVLQNNRLCMWGTPDVVRPLVGIVCGGHAPGPLGLRVSTVPVFMPPRIAPLPQRLAVVPADGRFDSEITSWLDLTLNFLRTRHRNLVLVEREDLRSVLDEVDLQYGGHADDETTIHVGRLVGADSLLTYRVVLSETDRTAALELRLLRVESGTTVFRQMVSVNQIVSDATAGATPRPIKSNPLPRRRVLKEAAAYGLAALAAAFGDNPLGIVSDYAWSGDGIKVIDVLQGGPASRSGLQPGDQILNCDGQPVGSWSDPLALPARLSVKREGASLNLYVE